MCRHPTRRRPSCVQASAGRIAQIAPLAETGSQREDSTARFANFDFCFAASLASRKARKHAVLAAWMKRVPVKGQLNIGTPPVLH